MRSAISPSTSARRSSCASSKDARTSRSPRSSTSRRSAVETLIFRRDAHCASSSKARSRAARQSSRSRDSSTVELPRGERGQLRAHLRECAECSSFARRQRAQRGALKTLALVPVPTSLTSLFGGGSGAAVGTGLALKAAAAVTAGLALGGAGYEGVRHAPWHAPRQSAAATAKSAAAVAVSAPDNNPSAPSRAASRATVPATHAKPGRVTVGPKGQKAAAHGRGQPTPTAVRSISPVTRASPPVT